jgi:translation elongation factor EF-G
VIRAEAALSALLGYNGALRKLTSGTGTFSIKYLGHAEMSEFDVGCMPG